MVHFELPRLRNPFDLMIILLNGIKTYTKLVKLLQFLRTSPIMSQGPVLGPRTRTGPTGLGLRPLPPYSSIKRASRLDHPVKI